MITLSDYSIGEGVPRLSKVSASIPGARLTIVAGPNGAGKSLLLKAIAGRLPASPHVSSGCILIEHCGSAATTDQGRADLVDYLAQDERGCTSADGGWTEGRVTALRDLVNRGRSVLLLDDPTCGFDTRLHATWMQNLWELSRNGRTIIMAVSDVPRTLPWADWAVLIHQGGLFSGPAAELSREASDLPTARRSAKVLSPAHSAQLKTLVCSHLGLDTASQVHIEQTCMSGYPTKEPLALVSVPEIPGATWVFTCDAEDLSPYLLNAELAAYPKGHTYAPTA